MWKKIKLHCTHKTKALAVEHLEVLAKSPKVIESGVVFDGQWKSWWVTTEWSDEEPELHD